jgi:hypothetical protein
MYYALYTRDAVSVAFAMQFGDYDRDTVIDERQDYLDHGHKASNIRIVRYAADAAVPTFLS